MANKPKIRALTIITILTALHLSRVLYKTANFIHNKPNLPSTQMNITKVLTRNYEIQPLYDIPKPNPIQTQLSPIKANLRNAQMNITKVLTKDYENHPLCRQTQNKKKNSFGHY